MHDPAMHTSRKKHSAKPSEVKSVTERDCNSCQKFNYCRKSRAKRCIGWENYIARTNSACVNRIPPIARRFPDLTPHQLRIAALVAELLPSWEIAKILGVNENAVNKVRCRIRAGIAICEGAPLAAFLLAKAA